MWVCASQASGGSLNFGVFVCGSGPGIVGVNIVLYSMSARPKLSVLTS